jgi:hypothetical protein
MKRIALSFVLPIFTCAVLVSQTHQDPAKVYVVIESGGSAYKATSNRTVEISEKNRPPIAAKNIVVTFLHVRRDDFAHFVNTVSPIDIIVCDNTEQLSGNPSLKRAAERGVNVCGNAGKCTAFISSSVTTDRQAAVQQVFQTITQR